MRGLLGVSLLTDLLLIAVKMVSFISLNRVKISPDIFQFYLSNQDQIQNRIFFVRQPWSESQIQQNDFLPGKNFKNGFGREAYF